MKGSPLVAVAEDTYTAARPHTRLALGMMGIESRWFTQFNRNVKANNNPFNLKYPDRDAFMTFFSPAEGVKAWKERITSPTYKDGVYARTQTLEELIHVFAPEYDDNREDEYVAFVLVITEGLAKTMALNMTKGLIPLPAFTDAIIDVSRRNQSSECRGYDYLGPRADPPRFLALHRPQSDLYGTNEGYLRQTCCPALFEFEVNGNGVAKRFALRGDAPSGWANGRVSQPYGDALKYLEFYGWDVNDANQHGETLEVGGWFYQPGTQSHEDPITEAQRAWVAQWMASRAHDYGIPWHEFPIIVSENGRSYITWHQEWTFGTGKVCPGETLMAETPALIVRAQNIMRFYQEGTPVPTPPTYEMPKLPDWWSTHLAQSWPSDAKWNELTFRVLRRNFKALKVAVRRSEPLQDAAKSGPNIAAGESVHVERSLLVPVGNRNIEWLVTHDGHYVRASSFRPRVYLR